MPIDIEKARVITKDSNGIVKTSIRHFAVEAAFYQAFGVQVKLLTENNRGSVVDRYLLSPTKARELAVALIKIAEDAEKKYGKFRI